MDRVFYSILPLISQLKIDIYFSNYYRNFISLFRTISMLQEKEFITKY